MTKRIITAVVLIAVVVLGIWLQGWVLRALLLAAMLVSVDEMYRAFAGIGHRPIRWVGYVYCALAVLAQALSAAAGGAFAAVDPALLALGAGVLLAAAVVVLRGEVDFDALVSTAFPMLYPGLFFSMILTLQDLPDRATATLALVLAFFIASVNDTFALFIGLKFGRHRLSPQISPKKSVEGAVAGLASSVGFAVLAAWGAGRLGAAALPPLWAFALLGLFAGALSQIGDLTASLVKRHCGIKDFGNLFPGHGGMLDRMDGILFCGAACWLFFALCRL